MAVDDAMLALLGNFDFQKLLALQQEDPAAKVLPAPQQQVALDTPMQPVQGTAPQGAGGPGGEDDLMQLAQLAISFL